MFISKVGAGYLLDLEKYSWTIIISNRLNKHMGKPNMCSYVVGLEA